MTHPQAKSQNEQSSLVRPESCRPESLPATPWALKLNNTAGDLLAPNPIKLGSLVGRPVQRPTEQLRLHVTLVQLKLIESAIELNQAVRLQGRSVPEPILITGTGIIISGFRQWHDAVNDGRPAVDCIEYSLNDEQALEYILIQHRPRRAWNSFTRARLALDLEPYFQRKALANQIAGGRVKGWANLPKAEHIEVREEIAGVAGVGGRTVANVKTILRQAAPALIESLQIGTLTINRALQWCSLPQWKQVEQLTSYVEQRTTSKVICQAVNHAPLPSDCLDTSRVLQALQGHAAQTPGSVVVRASQRSKTVIFRSQVYSRVKPHNCVRWSKSLLSSTWFDNSKS